MKTCAVAVVGLVVDHCQMMKNRIAERERETATMILNAFLDTFVGMTTVIGEAQVIAAQKQTHEKTCRGVGS